jgi:hypothetical protein
MTELKTPYDNVAFLFFLSHWELIKELTPEECMRVLQAVFACAGANCEMPEEMNRMERAVFKAIWGDVERSLINYDERREKRAEAGRKGGLKKAENARLAKASTATNADVANLANLPKDKATDKDNAMDTDMDNVCMAPDGACAADAAPHAHAASQKSAKSSLSKEEAEHFEALWQLYPYDRGKNQVSAKTKRALMAVSVEEMAQAIERYMEEVKASPADRQLLNGSTWFNGRYKDYLGDDYTPAPQIAGTKQPPKPSTRAQQTRYRSPEEEARSARYYASIEE